MAHRKAARVLPEPVGARMRVWSPRAIASHPCSWASVGAAKVASNQARVGAEKRSREATAPPRLRGSRDKSCPQSLETQGGDGRGMDDVRWQDRPNLRSPVLVAAFEGWNDAGDAASTAARYLADAWSARSFA